MLHIKKHKRTFRVLFLLIVMVVGGCLTFMDFLSSTKAADKAPPPLTPGRSLGNLHMHTTCSDGWNTYEAMVQEALRLNMSFQQL